MSLPPELEYGDWEESERPGPHARRKRIITIVGAITALAMVLGFIVQAFVGISMNVPEEPQDSPGFLIDSAPLHF